MLLEVVLAVALFVGAASFCMVATRSLFGTLERIDRRQRVIDLSSPAVPSGSSTWKPPGRSSRGSPSWS